MFSERSGRVTFGQRQNRHAWEPLRAHACGSYLFPLALFTFDSKNLTGVALHGLLANNNPARSMYAARNRFTIPSSLEFLAPPELPDPRREKHGLRAEKHKT